MSSAERWRGRTLVLRLTALERVRRSGVGVLIRILIFIRN